MIKKNIIANLFGKFWSFFSAFLFTPLYIHYLGIEGFSIISFSLVITGFISIFDAGLSATISREYALKTNNQSDKKNVFSTYELFYFGIIFLTILTIFIFSNLIATRWLNFDLINPLKVPFYIKLIGIGTAFQLISNFYFGGLLGLELQVKGNYYQVGWGIVRNALVVIPLIYYPSLELFFIWQTATTIIYAFLLRRSLLNELKIKIPIIRRPVVDKSILKRTWKFAGGMLLISIVASLNTQMDKLAISKLLPISILAFYTLAISLAQSIFLLVSPISIAILPRFTSLYSEKKIVEIFSIYKRMSILISIIVFSLGFNIIFYAKDLIWIWTGNISLANNVYNLVPYLTFGMIFYTFQLLPYTIAVANGYTKLNNIIGLASLFLTIPGYWLMTKHFAAIGAAITWSSVQIILTFIYVYLINKKFLPNIKHFQYVLNDFIKPAFIAITVTYLFHQFTYFKDNRFCQLFWIGLSTSVSLISCVLLIVRKSEYVNLKSMIKL